MKQTYFNNNPDGIFNAAYNVLSEKKNELPGDIVEAKLAFTDLKKPVQDQLLKIFQMYDNTSLSQNQKDGIAAVFKYGLEFSDFTRQQSFRQGR